VTYHLGFKVASRVTYAIEPSKTDIANIPLSNNKSGRV